MITPEGKNLFRDLMQLVPPENREAYWQMLVHLQRMFPDDEILRVCQAMGVLAMIARQIPQDLGAQRQAWNASCQKLGETLRTMLAEAEARSVAMASRVTELSGQLKATSNEVRQSCESVRQAMRDGANSFSTTQLAQEVHEKMKATILTPTEDSVRNVTAVVQRFDRSLSDFRGTISRLEEFSRGNVWRTAFLVCGLVAVFLVIIATMLIDRWYRDTLRQYGIRAANAPVRTFPFTASARFRPLAGPSPDGS